MPWSSHENHVEIEIFDDPIQVCIYKGEGRAGAPMPKHAGLDMLGFEWLAKQRIILQVNHPQRQIVAGTPKGVHLARLFVAERCTFNCGARDSIAA